MITAPKTRHKLIIVEGLPCSGKSTTSRYIAEKLGAEYFDEDTGRHPADYEFHAYLRPEELEGFSPDERESIEAAAQRKSGGYIIPLAEFGGELFDRLLRHKIYDFLPWETERPVMLDKWREFAAKAKNEDKIYVFNSVLMQNPMCEARIRFDMPAECQRYIYEIRDIIKPLDPFVVYLHYKDIRPRIERAMPERGEDWLRGVIDYHCNSAYGRAHSLEGFDGYITALEYRQQFEMYILKRGMHLEYMVLEDPDADWERAYDSIIARLSNGDSVS